MENLREALIKADYTVDGVLEVLGPLAYAALARSESVPALRATTGGSPVETLIRLFLLQQPVERKAVEAAIPVEESVAAELVTLDGDLVRAAIDIRPYGDDDGHDWYLVSDLSGGLHAQGQGHPVREDHVLGRSSWPGSPSSSPGSSPSTCARARCSSRCRASCST